VASTFLLIYPLGTVGIVYAAIATTLGWKFIQKSWQLLHNPTDIPLARSTFKYSIIYMMLLCLGIVVDTLPETHALTATLADNLQTIISAIPIMQ